MSALTAWARDGVPSSPGAWLTTAARRNALNALRRGQVLRTKLPLLLEREPAEEDDPMDTGAPDAIPDDRLRLVFTCCHPALAREAQVALTLRLVCGVATGDIAQAFLVSEPTMAARLTRAKKKIAAARIPYRRSRGGGPPGAARRGPEGHPPPVHDGPHRAVRRGPRARRSRRARDRSRADAPRPAARSRRSSGSSRYWSSTTRAARPGPTPTDACSASRIRTARPGTGTPSPRATGSSSPRSTPDRPVATRCRRRSPRCTPRPRRTTRPTGRRSSSCTTRCSRPGRRRSSR